MRSPVIPLDAQAQMTYDFFAGDCADLYSSELVFPHLAKLWKKETFTKEDFFASLTDPENCLKVFFGHYAFSRRGKDREELARLAVSSLEEAFATHKEDGGLLSKDSGEEIWTIFVRRCEAEKKKTSEVQNRGLLQGLIELAQEVQKSHPGLSIASWISETIQDDQGLEEQFSRIVDIRGVGPKVTSTFLRDLTMAYGIEAAIDPADRLYVQPVDRWLRLIAPIVVPEEGMEQAADWIVAGKISKYCRRAKVEGVRFNAGVTYFGQKIVRDPAQFHAELGKALKPFAESWQPRS